MTAALPFVGNAWSCVNVFAPQMCVYAAGNATCGECILGHDACYVRKLVLIARQKQAITCQTPGILCPSSACLSIILCNEAGFSHDCSCICCCCNTNQGRLFAYPRVEVVCMSSCSVCLLTRLTFFAVCRAFTQRKQKASIKSLSVCRNIETILVLK